MQFVKYLVDKLYLAVLLLVLVGVVQSKIKQKHLQGVIIFNEQNFNQALQDFQILIIAFQQESCQYCQQFKLTYAMIAEQYNKNLLSKKQTYQGLARLSRENIQIPLVQFGKLKFNQNTAQIFKSHNIEMVPSVRIFINKQMLTFTFQSLDYDDSIIQNFIQWIVRSLTQIHQVQQLQALPYSQTSIIIYCESDYIGLFNELRNKKLQYTFFCSHQREVTSKAEISIYEKNMKVHTINLFKQQEKSQIKPNLQRHGDQINFQAMFQRYFDYQIHQWNNEMIYDVFSKNKSAFILIINNQTRSQNALQNYKRIKTQVFNQNHRIPSTRFTITNLAQTPQQTNKIKKYILGGAVSVYKKYPYPILAYLKRGHYYRVSKYVFMHDMTKDLSFVQMKRWMVNVVTKLQLKEQNQKDIVKEQNQKDIVKEQNQKNIVKEQNQKDIVKKQNQQDIVKEQNQKDIVKKQNQQDIVYQQENMFAVQQWFNNSPESIFKNELNVKSIQPNNSMRVISYSDLNLLLKSKNSTQPFFVYFSWRNDLQSVSLGQAIRLWWMNQIEKQLDDTNQDQQMSDQPSQNQPQNQNKYAKLINMYVCNLNFNDYPNFQNLQVKYIPSLFYFSAHKKIQKLHGITEGISQVKQFIQSLAPFGDQSQTIQEALDQNQIKTQFQNQKTQVINQQSQQHKTQVQKDQHLKLHQVQQQLRYSQQKQKVNTQLAGKTMKEKKNEQLTQNIKKSQQSHQITKNPESVKILTSIYTKNDQQIVYSQQSKKFNQILTGSKNGEQDVAEINQSLKELQSLQENNDKSKKKE